MDGDSFLEAMSRLASDLDEAIDCCHTDEPLSLVVCLSQLRIILADAHKMLRSFERSVGKEPAC